jgi:hypothetical protein
VSARCGWTNDPYAIKLATLIQAARLYEPRHAVAGPLTRKEVDDVALQWGTGSTVEVGSDVMAAIAPYRRPWAAV